MTTEQSIFTTVATHLLKQNKQCSNDTGKCFYQHPDNPDLQCAVGVLLTPKQRLAADAENSTVDDIQHILPKRYLPHIKFLGTLQIIHDTSAPTQWPQALSAMAGLHNLEMPK